MYRLNRESFCKKALFGDPFKCTFLKCIRNGSYLVIKTKVVCVSSGCKNENTTASLGITIISSVNDTPFYTITFIVQTTKDDAEVTTTLLCRRFQQSVDVLQKNELRVAKLDDLINRPPKNTLFTFDTLSASMCNRVVLSMEATYQQVVCRHSIDHRGNVFIAAVSILSKSLAVTFIGPLASLTRFPLTCPNSFELRRAAFKTYAEATNTRKKLDYSDFLCIIHFRASSFCAILIHTNTV